MAYRIKMARKKSRRLFRKKSRVSKKNFKTGCMRGGIRL